MLQGSHSVCCVSAIAWCPGWGGPLRLQRRWSAQSGGLTELVCLVRSAEPLLTCVNPSSAPDSCFQCCKPVSQLKRQTKMLANHFLFGPAPNLYPGTCTSSCSGVTGYFLFSHGLLFPDLSQHRPGSSISDAQEELNLYFLRRILFGLVVFLWQFSAW